jgi:hypothetical protein
MYRAEALRVPKTSTADGGRQDSDPETPSRNLKTNNQDSFGGSLLKNNMEVEAAMELQRHPAACLDETGGHRVCTVYVGGFFGLHHVRLKIAF